MSSSVLDLPDKRIETADTWPSFSIVIPTYQRREVVCAAVGAIGRLVYPGAFEVLIVVDGSTDGTVQALRELSCPVPVTVIEQPNSGAARARNRGAAAANNDILLFLDDDMMADPPLLAQHARMYRAGADAVVGDTLLDPASPPGFLSESIKAWIDASRVGGPLSPFDVWAGQLSVRRSVFRQLGGFDESFTSDGAFANEDADFGVNLLARFTVHHNPQAISRQRYVVSPRELMERAPLWVSGDVRFVEKHPHLTRDLFVARGSARRLTRFVYRPLASLPLVPWVMRHTGVWIANAALKSPLRSSLTMARMFSGARAVSYWAIMKSNGWFPTSERLLVLCYHAIRDEADDPFTARFTVTPDQFVEQIDSLRRRGYTFVGPDALAAYLLNNAPMPRKAVLLTFDDCYSELLTIARDILHPRGIRALAFAVSRMATNAWDRDSGAARMRLLGSNELLELSAAGVEIASHSCSHADMSRLDEEQNCKEASDSASDLQRLGVPRPRYFAYPFGELSPAAVHAVREAGYLAAFGIEARWTTRRSDPFNLPRVVIHARDRGWRFRFKTRAPSLYNWLADPRALVEYAFRRLGRLIRGQG